MVLLLISLAALALGPLLYRMADRAPWAMAALDGFVMATVSGLVLVHLIPDAMETAGVWAALVALLGFFGPGIIEHTLHRAARQAHAATLALAMVGLAVHAFFDGVGLSTPLHDHNGNGSVLAIAVALHQLPVAVMVWATLSPVIGSRGASAVLFANIVATLIGFVLGDVAATTADARWMALAQALITGSLLHVVLHRPGAAAPASSSRRLNWIAGAAAIAGMGAVAALSDTHFPQTVSHAAGFGETFMTLALASAPALLMAFALAALVQVAIPQPSPRWLTGHGPARTALRGLVFGLPLPICACSAVPLYRTLVATGVPVAAAIAFLVATPLLGIDAVLISIPLLGAELTLLRVAGAALVAAAAGAMFSRLSVANADHGAGEALPVAPSGAAVSRVLGGLRFGFSEVVDHIGPWLVLGLTMAAVAEPLIDRAWIAAIPWGLDVVLFALLGVPSYVCASAATPLAAVLILKGVSPGAAIAFLLTGPAANMTAFRVLSRLHGRSAAVAFASSILGLAIGLGLLVNVASPARLPAITDLSLESHGALEWASLLGLALAFAISILRQGPRGFIAQVITPYGEEGGHGHGHDHDHAH